MKEEKDVGISVEYIITCMHLEILVLSHSIVIFVLFGRINIIECV